jgi:hypothetical protein
VRFVAIAVASLALAVPAAGSAATPTATTVTGTIEVLKPRTISVHGVRHLTCRVVAGSPRPRLRGFAPGAKARITCVKGVLSAIARPWSTTGGVRPSGNAMTTKPEPTPDPEPGGSGVKVAPDVNGTSTITAIAGGTIVFGGSISCLVNASSPSLARYGVGSRVSYSCAGGYLTAIGPGEGT